MNRVRCSLFSLIVLLVNATAQPLSPQPQMMLHYTSGLAFVIPHEQIQVQVGGGIDTLFHAAAGSFTNIWNQKTRSAQFTGYWIVGLALTGGENVVDQKFLEVLVTSINSGAVTTSVAKIPLNMETDIPQACEKATLTVLQHIGAKRPTRSTTA